MFSDCRREPGVVITELCILDLPHCSRGFSDTGDSGAVGIDRQRRVIGILHGGEMRTGGFKEMTYATPMQYLIENIAESLGSKVEIA